MSVTAVQFFGVDSVVEAYTNKGTPAFAIWCAKQLQFRYDGADSEAGPTMEEGEQLLRAYLEGMWEGTTATYTLKVYDELQPGQKIRPSTEYDTAFNFKISLPQSKVGGYSSGNHEVLSELQRMRADIEQMKNGPGDEDDDEDDDEDEPETIQQAVIGLLREPERLQQVIGPIRELMDMGRTLFGSGDPMQQQQQQQYLQQQQQQQYMQPMRSVPGTMTGMKKVGTVAPSEEQVIRLGQAINTLEQHDDKLVEHLEKLAQVAATDPEKFKGLLTMLDLL